LPHTALRLTMSEQERNDTMAFSTIDKKLDTYYKSTKSYKMFLLGSMFSQ
jgi:hypothetical protein